MSRLATTRWSLLARHDLAQLPRLSMVYHCDLSKKQLECHMVISPKTDALAFLIQICILGHKLMKVLVVLLRYHVFK